MNLVEQCREMVAHARPGGAPIALTVYPGVHHNFDVALLTPGVRYRGFWLEYNEPAAKDAEKKTRACEEDGHAGRTRGNGNGTARRCPRVSTAYLRFAEDEVRDKSPLYCEFSRGAASDPEVIGFLLTMPREKRQPNLFLAAARHLFGTPAGWDQLRNRVLQHKDALRAMMLTRSTQTNEPGRCAALLPVPAGLPEPLALLEVGASAGLCLLPDFYAYDYGGAILAPEAQRLTPPVFTCAINAATPGSALAAPAEAGPMAAVPGDRSHGRQDSDRRSARVGLLTSPTLETTMQVVADRAEAPTAIQTELRAIFVSLELSRSTWLITSLSPGGGEKMSKHSVQGGDNLVQHAIRSCTDLGSENQRPENCP